MSYLRQAEWPLITMLLLAAGFLAAQDSNQISTPSAGKAIQEAAKGTAQDHIAAGAGSSANPPVVEKSPHDSCRLAPPPDETSSFPIDVRSYVGGVRFGPYVHDLCVKVGSNWRAALKGVERSQHVSGKTTIQFAVKQDGSIAALSVLESSGDATLDQIALAAVAHTAPFDPLPMKFRGEFFQLRLRFFYNLGKHELDEAGHTATHSPM
jgi:TonB family protein